MLNPQICAILIPLIEWYNYKYLLRYLSSWGMSPLSINFVDNEVTWGGDTKYNIQIWCNQL